MRKRRLKGLIKQLHGLRNRKRLTRDTLLTPTFHKFTPKRR